MSFNTIEFIVDSGAAIITLNRPDKFNSFNTEMHNELKTVMKEIRNNSDIRSLLITGKGRAFSAGQDLNDRTVSADGEAPDLGDSVEQNYNPLIRSITSLDIPVICAVNGIAAGAGVSVALACDIVLAARSSAFMMAFCKIGVIPDSGSTWILPRLVGMARARALSLLGDKLSAEKAEQWGLIWQCIDDDKLATESVAMAKHLATQPTKGLSLIKRALKASTANSLDEQLELEKDFMRIAGRTSDYREGVAAFTEKRAANFTGK